MDPINRPGIGSVGVIGASPNASGASITGNVLTLQPASASFGGVLTSGAQTIAGAKTFTGAQTIGTVSSSLAGLSVGLTVGATNAQFGNTFGLFFISNYPQIAYNGYYNGGFKAHTAGYVATNVFDPTVGTLTLACSTTAPIADGAATMTNLLTLSKIGDAGFLSATASTSTTTGALVVTGGIGCGGRVTVDGATTKTLKYVNGVANAAVAVAFGAVGPTGSTAGNAQGWIRIDVAGTDRYIPYW